MQLPERRLQILKKHILHNNSAFYKDRNLISTRLTENLSDIFHVYLIIAIAETCQRKTMKQ